nr:hypothetical protein [Neorhizobium tomejilense]
MTATDILTAEMSLPRIASCRSLPEFGVEILWRDGGTDIVDVSPALRSRPVFAAVLASQDIFRNCAVSEYGDSVEWEDGSELSAVWIARLAGRLH